MHCTVHRWTPAVARAGRADLDRIYEMHGGPLYVTAHDPHGGDFEKWRKFVVHFGFRFATTVTTADGVRHSIYMRDRCRF